MSENYFVGYRCGNCYFTAKVGFEKGKEAYLFLTCPNCGMQGEFKKKELNFVPNSQFIFNGGKLVPYDGD